MSHHKKHHEKDPVEAQPPAESAPPPQPSAEPAPAQAAPAQSADDNLAKLKAERDDYLARLQRVSADFVNYQKRAQREMSESREYANADLLKSLLPVLDDLERAIEAAAKTSSPDDPLLKGVQLVHQKATTILGTHNLTPMAAEGKPFDPQKHQAVVHLPTDEVPPNTVVKELQRGYLLKGRTLRPATVAVSSPPQEEDKKQKEEPGVK